MTCITSRVSQATFDLIRQKGVSVRAVLEAVMANYDEATFLSMGLLTHAKSGRRHNAVSKLIGARPEVAQPVMGKTITKGPPRRI